MLKLILASGSPRRKDILEEAGFKPLCFPTKLSEKLSKKMSLDESLMELAQTKVEACLEEHNLLESQDILVVGSDTVVVFQGEVLGKPKNHDQAFEFLNRMSGLSHEVKTSVCVSNRETGEIINFVDTSVVTFNNLTDEQIWRYVKTDEPMDKAGAYGIQTTKDEFVQKFEGSFKSIMGFPIKKFIQLINEKEWSLDRS